MMFRWIALAILVAGIGISAYHRRRARVAGETISRSRESTGLILGRLLVALPLFGGVLVYVANPASMAWASLNAPTWLRVVGVLLGLLTLPSAWWVLRSLGRNVSETVLTKSHHQLVTHGPYRWVRHPLYTTGIALFASLGLMASNWFILLFTLIALFAIRFVVVPLEERELLQRFGEAYRSYMRQTGRLLPRVTRETASQTV